MKTKCWYSYFYPGVVTKESFIPPRTEEFIVEEELSDYYILMFENGKKVQVKKDSLIATNAKLLER